MGFPTFLVLLILFILVFRHNLAKQSKMANVASTHFWKKQETSLVVRKQEISSEYYLHPTLNFTEMPTSLRKDKNYFDTYTQKEALYKCQERLVELSQKPMVNLSHLDNADIRLTFGTANFTHILSYEENYHLYIRNLHVMGRFLYENKDFDLSRVYLEEGLKVKTDISGHLTLLADLYVELRLYENLEALLEYARQIDSPMGGKTVHYIERKLLPY